MLANPAAAVPPPWLVFTISLNSSRCCWMNRQRDWVHSLHGSIIPRFFDLFCSCMPALYAACILINQTPRKCGTSNSYNLCRICSLLLKMGTRLAITLKGFPVASSLKNFSQAVLAEGVFTTSQKSSLILTGCRLALSLPSVNVFSSSFLARMSLKSLVTFE